MVRIARDKGGWFSVDEVGFGPSREPRRLPPRLRALGTALVLAGAAAAAVAFAVTAAHGQHPVPPSPASQAAPPAPAVHLTLTVCAPVDTTWPNLAALPAPAHPGALGHHRRAVQRPVPAALARGAGLAAARARGLSASSPVASTSRNAAVNSTASDRVA